MSFIDFSSFSISVNAVIFFVSAALIWMSGTRLSEYLDVVADKIGMGKGYAGLLLLGGITSLPEFATVATAAIGDNAPLAVNNMLGSIAINIVILAAADAVVGHDALTSVVAHSSTLLQGTLSVLLLAVLGIAAVTGAGLFLGASIWTWIMLGVFLLSMIVAAQYRRRNPWIIRRSAQDDGDDDRKGRGAGEKSARKKFQPRKEELESMTLAKLVTKTSVAAVMILVAGFFLAKTGESLARQSGLGQSYFGLVLLAFATGLPEMSSVYSAMRIGRYEMAVGDIFGTNLWNVAIIGFADFMYRGGSALESIGRFEILAVFLSILLTCIFIVGLLERRDQTIYRMGIDSFVVIVTYLAGLVLLYFVQASDQKSLTQVSAFERLRSPLSISNVSSGPQSAAQSPN